MENKELEKWLRETKAKNLSLEELKNNIFSFRTNEIFFIKLRNKLGIKQGESVVHALFNLWNAHKGDNYAYKQEWQPKRGDRVLVWEGNDDAIERIFLAEIKGLREPIVVVNGGYEEEFKNNEPFESSQFMHMKPIPTEQPKETDFKSKVIDVIEKRIKSHIQYEEANHIGKSYLNCILWENSANEAREILKQIKELK